MKTIREEIIESTEARRHNGQCAYGEWMPLEDAPEYVQEVVADEVAEHPTEGAGTIEVGGERWIYRR